MGAPTPDEIILGILAARPQHGYQLLAHFNHPENLGRVWSMSTSQVYAVLKRLQEEELVAGKIVAAANAPSRTEFSPTPKGKDRFRAWLYDPDPSPNIRRVRIDFISRLYVAGLLDLPVNDLFEQQRQACLRQKEKLEQALEEGRSPNERAVTKFILGQLNAAMEWLNDYQVEFPKE
jgi:DNA-binding PadR family transcriptional regulator